jgi:soluble lytic murein transglycosylase-like protein
MLRQYLKGFSLLLSFRVLLPVLGLSMLVSGCTIDTLSTGGAVQPMVMTEAPSPAASGPARLDDQIAHYAALYSVPESLLRRVIARESGYNPLAHHGRFYGLMQITLATARSMGFRGEERELLLAETNLRYGGKYLAGAYIVSGNDQEKAIRLYSKGFYYDAKRKGMLGRVGLSGR